MSVPPTQGDLFATPSALPEGFDYRPGFVSEDEERELAAAIAALPLHPAQYKTYEARRRILSFGSSYDFTANRLQMAPGMPAFLFPLRERAAAWLQLEPAAFEHALLTEYLPGTPIGWHRDTPDFEIVAGVSLLGRCRMRLRPYPRVPRSAHAVIERELAPRSAYVLRGAARWRWQHHIPPTTEHRYSITFRTLAPRGTRRQPRL